MGEQQTDVQPSWIFSPHKQPDGNDAPYYGENKHQKTHEEDKVVANRNLKIRKHVRILTSLGSTNWRSTTYRIIKCKVYQQKKKHIEAKSTILV